jgi:hypothetical protein
MIVAFVCLYDQALGEYVLKLMNEDYKMKYMMNSRPSIQGLCSFLVKAMRQVSLNILHLYTFLSII